MTFQLRQASGLVWGLCLGLGAAGLLTPALLSPAFAAPPYAIKDMMVYVPKQKDVEYETPKPEEYAKCKVEVERRGKGSGWVVLGPAGQVLRKFLDTDGDNKMDQWRFYNQGVEVYRDIDSNANDKVDQSRWLNLGGSRWGIDQNEDGRIDAWKILSAAEASKEAVRAMVAGDDDALQLVMVNAADLKAVGLSPPIAAKLLESSADAGKKARAVVSKSRSLNAQSKWVRFDALMPSTIPEDEEKATGDLQVYENAMAIIESQGKFVGVQIGEMIRVGEVWKLTQIPQPIEENGVHVTAGGVLMQPLVTAAGGAANTGTSPEVEKLLVELQTIEQGLMKPNADRTAVKTLMGRRADLLRRAIELAETDDEKLLLTKQMIDGYALAAQMGTFPDGAADLRAMELDLRRRNPKSALVPYVAYRRIQAQYYVELQQAEKDKASEVQKEWVKGMEDFLKEFPDSEDGADAMLLLAHHEELSGRTREAADWYQRLARDRAKTDSGLRATGALRRLDLKGKPLVLNGPGIDGGAVDIRSYRGKTVLVVFWASEYRVCEEDLPQLRALYQEYRAKGFEILGVCLDSQKETVKPFLSQHRMTWGQIYQPGGLNAPAAMNYGVVSLPTMFLVNSEGIVISRNATVQEVKTALPTVLAGK
jgi:peroxiredoxin